jgi:hypothetical protein
MSDRITAVTMMRDEAPALLEWVAFQDVPSASTGSWSIQTIAATGRTPCWTVWPDRRAGHPPDDPPSLTEAKPQALREGRRRTSRFWKPTG